MAKKKICTGNTPIGGKAMKSRRIARRVTSKYHEIRNELNIIERSKTPNKDNLKAKLVNELKEIGGINAYQQASIISTKHFSTSKWIIKKINQLMNENKLKCHDIKPHVLEVGAINTSLKTSKSLHVRSIDIHSQSPLIEEIDFFDIIPTRQYDVVVCSMVVNCVPSPEKRGEMLCRLLEHFHENGALILVLPLRCINSPYVGMDSFEKLLEGLGCIELIPKRLTPHLVFYTLGKRQVTSMISLSSSVHNHDLTTASNHCKSPSINNGIQRKLKHNNVHIDEMIESSEYDSMIDTIDIHVPVNTIFVRSTLCSSNDDDDEEEEVDEDDDDDIEDDNSEQKVGDVEVFDPSQRAENIGYAEFNKKRKIIQNSIDNDIKVKTLQDNQQLWIHNIAYMISKYMNPTLLSYFTSPFYNSRISHTNTTFNKKHPPHDSHRNNDKDDIKIFKLYIPSFILDYIDTHFK